MEGKHKEKSMEAKPIRKEAAGEFLQKFGNDLVARHQQLTPVRDSAKASGESCVAELTAACFLLRQAVGKVRAARLKLLREAE